ncbi:hypothetical protein [uncultured Thomasclavelia sp.]|uniref:hypothetical protein n=1 Tax=uncultured Thomasclavelia sp. TaxID=3025759 RepID=UPI0025E17CD5|nr:hypothetical protein [uncultured Thomasclavelia sp.]
MEEISRKRFKKLLYYFLLFMGIGVDMTLEINYCFTFAIVFLGQLLLLEEKKLSEILIKEYIIGLLIIPVICKLVIKFLF